MTEDERLDIALFRYAVIRPLLAEDLTVGERRALRAEISAQTHDIPHSHKTRIAARTLRRWLQRYREAGFEGLKPRSRSDRGRPRRLTPAVIEQAAALRRELPTRSIRQLIALLEDAGHAALGQVKPSTLARALRARGLTRTALAAPRRVYRHFEAPHRNALWQADLSHGPYLPHPHDPDKRRKTYLLAILDDRSRLVVYAAFFWEQDGAALEVALRQAILRYGVPERLYVDNGKIFVARRVQLACARLGIELVRQTPYRPEGKGKIERSFGTVKQAFYPEAKALGPETLDELNRLFWAWLDEDYHHRIHSTTGETPAARFAQDPHPLREVDPQQLLEAFWTEVERTVTKTGTVSLEGHTYEVDPALIGRRIRLRYDPHDLRRIEVADLDGHPWGEAVPVRLDRDAARAPDRGADRNTPATPKTSYLEVLRRRHDERLRAELRGIPFADLIEDRQPEATEEA